VPSPHAIVEGVRKLPPAHRLVWERGGWREGLYWEAGGAEKLGMGEDEATEEVRRRLGEAVGRRLVADVPLGILLSGGIDSSAGAALAPQRGARRVPTVSSPA